MVSLLVNIRFQVLFHRAIRPSFHLSLTVLVHYRSESIFSLMAWSPQIHTGLHVSCATWGIAHRSLSFIYEAVTLFGDAFQRLLLLSLLATGAPQPDVPDGTSFRLFPFRSPLLRESLLFSFPALN